MTAPLGKSHAEAVGEVHLLYRSGPMDTLAVSGLHVLVMSDGERAYILSPAGRFSTCQVREWLRELLRAMDRDPGLPPVVTS